VGCWRGSEFKKSEEVKLWKGSKATHNYFGVGGMTAAGAMTARRGTTEIPMLLKLHLGAVRLGGVLSF
jgi:hypothetical protein